MHRLLLYIFIATWPLLQLIKFGRFGEGFFVLDVIRPFTLLLLMIAIFLYNKESVINRVFVCWAIFITYFVINIYINGSSITFKEIVRNLITTYMIPLSMYFVIANIGESLNTKKLVNSIQLSGIIVAGIGIAEFIAGHNLIGPENSTLKIYRINGPFDEGIGYAYIVLLYIPFTYYCIKEKLISKFLGFLYFIIFSIGVAFELGRAPLIAYLIICFILTLKNDIKSIMINSYLAAIFAIATYLSWDVITNTHLYRDRFANPEAVIGRWKQYKECLHIFASNPIIGIGHEMYKKTHVFYIHNTYLRDLVELGIFGFIFHALFIFVIMTRNIKRLLNAASIHVLKARISFIVIVLIVPNTIDLLNNYFFLLTLFIMLATLDLNRGMKVKETEEVTISSQPELSYTSA